MLQKVANDVPLIQLRRDMVLKGPILGYQLELVVSVHAVPLCGGRGPYQLRLNQGNNQCMYRYIGMF